MTESYRQKLLFCSRFSLQLAKKANETLCKNTDSKSIEAIFAKLQLNLSKIQEELCGKIPSFTEYTPIIKLSKKIQNDISIFEKQRESCFFAKDEKENSSGALYLFNKRNEQIGSAFSSSFLKLSGKDIDICLLQLMLTLCRAQAALCKNFLRFDGTDNEKLFAQRLLNSQNENSKKIEYILMCIN